MRVVVYSSIRLFGDALVACLERETEVVEVTTTSTTVDLATAMAENDGAPDVVLFDITSAEDIQAVRDLAEQHRSIPIVALCVPRIADDVIACADAGFASYVPRDSSYEELIEITRMALQGETPCDPKISRSLLVEIGRRRSDRADNGTEPSEPLTPRESQILGHLSRGLSNKEIATELNLSVATVKNHVHAVLRKLDLRRRSEVAALVSRRPWLLQRSA